MKRIVILLILVAQLVNLSAQPGEEAQETTYQYLNKPFLDLVNDEKYFAQYAQEVHSGSFDLMEPIKCKLHIPSGINKVWLDAENSKQYNNGDYNYANDFWVGIRFNFYIAGEVVATAFEDFEKPQEDTGFTFYFELNPIDFEQGEGDINFVYTELINKLQKSGSQLVIEAVLPSKNLNVKSYVSIATGSFYLRFDQTKYTAWKALQTQSTIKAPAQEIETPNKIDYNARLKHLSDNWMKQIFGNVGFSTNFTMSCLQNPCAKGYLYANTMETNNPCTTEPQDSCMEAIITYRFINEGVPLTIRLLVSIKDGHETIYVENKQYEKMEISLERQNLLSLTEIRKIISTEFPKDSLVVLEEKTLSYGQKKMEHPPSGSRSKLDKGPVTRLIKETRAGKKWESGFIYSAYGTNPNKLDRVYHFDAVTGKLLWITEIFPVTNASK
jgi:hypothetical protein